MTNLALNRLLPANLDGCSRDGAEKLADAVRIHWEQRGKMVKVTVGQSVEGMFIVRSNMKNGSPA